MTEIVNFTQDLKDIGCIKEHSLFLKELVDKNFFYLFYIV